MTMAAPLIVSMCLFTGVAMVFPVIPFQAIALGASPAVVAFLLVADIVTVLLAAYPVGRLSDRWGRKGVTVLGLAAAPVSFLVLAQAETLGAILLSRLLLGVALAVAPAIQAYVTERSDTRGPLPGLAGLNGVYGLAFVAGPLLTSLVIGQEEHYARAALTAAALAAAGASMAVAMFTDRPASPSVPAPILRPQSAARRTNLRATALLGPVAALSALVFAFASMNATLGVWSADVLGWQARQLSIAFAIAGMSAVVSQFGLVRILAGRLAETTLTTIAAAVMGLGFFLMATIPQGATTLLAMVLLGGGAATAFSCLQTMIARNAGPRALGGALGQSLSWSSLARILGPLWGGFAISHVGNAAPLLSAAVVVMLVALFLPHRTRVAFAKASTQTL